ncbi:hypothetical protein [Corynebacterium suicordis]|uniref:hypothetical protein n=1 Tax=Corynebacterium suicordis TaxID=203264 RepID=UPI00338E5EB2
MTVPDLEEATRFFKDGLGAKVSYDGLTTEEEPRSGEEVEQQLGLPSGAAIHKQRMFVIGEGPGLEVFEISGGSALPPAWRISGSITSAATWMTCLVLSSAWLPPVARPCLRSTATAATRTPPETAAYM